MKSNRIRKILDKWGEENEISMRLIDYFDNSIIGVDENGRVVYDFSRMLDEYVEDSHQKVKRYSDEENELYMEAEDFISYNTIRSIQYLSEDGGLKNPVIIEYNPTEDEEKYYNMINGEPYESEIIFRIPETFIGKIIKSIKNSLQR